MNHFRNFGSIPVQVRTFASRSSLVYDELVYHQLLLKTNPKCNNLKFQQGYVSYLSTTDVKLEFTFLLSTSRETLGLLSECLKSFDRVYSNDFY